MTKSKSSMAPFVGKGVIAGVAGTVVMTAFQKLIEMPMTGRPDSYVPAELAETVLRVRARSARRRKVLNYVVHFSLGSLWGAAYGVAAYAGLRGARATAVVYCTMYPADVLGGTAVAVYHPSIWSRQDWAIDAGEKLLQIVATTVVFDKALDHTR